MQHVKIIYKVKNTYSRHETLIMLLWVKIIINHTLILIQ